MHALWGDLRFDFFNRIPYPVALSMPYLFFTIFLLFHLQPASHSFSQFFAEALQIVLGDGSFVDQAEDVAEHP